MYSTYLVAKSEDQAREFGRKIEKEFGVDYEITENTVMIFELTMNEIRTIERWSL